MKHGLLRQPIGSTTEVRTNRKDHENAIWFLNNPNPMRHEKLLIYAELEVRRISQIYNPAWFIERARKEVPQKHQAIDTQIPPQQRSNDPTPHFVRSLYEGFAGGWARYGGDCGVFRALLRLQKLCGHWNTMALIRLPPRFAGEVLQDTNVLNQIVPGEHSHDALTAVTAQNGQLIDAIPPHFFERGP
jgi:hypothetical protein